MELTKSAQNTVETDEVSSKHGLTDEVSSKHCFEVVDRTDGVSQNTF
ncbi:hypothetical protein [Streptococcus pneumoniae]|nr:hypothetical protein [Streptococcus pneumoniae]